MWGLADVAEKWTIGPRVGQIASAAVIAVLCFLTYRQVAYWHDTFSLWSHTIAVTSGNYFADDLLASAFMAEHNPRALRYYQDAARAAPWDAISHGFVAAALEDQGHLREAIPEYEIVVRNPPDGKHESFAYLNLGIIYSELGNYGKADIAFSRVRAKDPDAINEMIQTLTAAVSARPADEGYVRLGLLLAQAGRVAEARAALDRALTMNPGRGDVRAALERMK